MSTGTESPSGSSVKFIPNQPRLKFKMARLYETIRHVVTYPKRSAFGYFFVSIAVWTGLFSAGVRLVYGKEHPINRYTWRKMKANGELTEEQLQKEEVFLAFYKEVLGRQLSFGVPQDTEVSRTFVYKNPRR